MAILSHQALDRLSTWVVRNILTDDCTILRETSTPLPSGGRHVIFVAQAETQPCALLDVGTPEEQLVAMQTVGSITKMVLFQRGANVLSTDRLRINDIEYHVIDLFDPSTYEVTRRVLVRRASLQGGM